ncbi:TPA: AbrB/MazE/SpoVT family DNA-binding domain-containing protein [Bacillus thuringiensis]|nr:AbrB/MazE/SpoVT family DNA-binding domain-containing protein [Bacillus thuringiensis]
MSTIVQKWGNSLAVRIPSVVAERVKIEQGSEIEMKVVGNERTIIITPRKTRKKYSLEELVSKITPENRHEYIDFGREGRELI